MQTEIVRIYAHGGPEVLDYGHTETTAPARGEVRIRQRAIGLNFADIYQRKGQAGPHDHVPFPIVLGSHGAGVIDALGAGVEGLSIGQEVGYLHAGAYCAIRNVPATRVIPLPSCISCDEAAASLLRGLTAEYLLRRLFTVKEGDTILIHAAAGGMGALLTQWGKALGARVIGTVGSPEKARIAREYGCDEVIDYSSEDFVRRTLQLTNDRGVDVVYDAVGKDVFVPSLECLRPMGMAINYGAASGPVGPFDIQLLHRKSLIVSRPTLRTYTATADALRASARAFFDIVERGLVRLGVARRYPLSEVRSAHQDLEGRATTGSSILVPHAA